MDQKEYEQFNEIIAKGYEKLIKERPQKSFEHFIYHLLEQVNEESRKIHPGLAQFYQKYKEELKDSNVLGQSEQQ